MPEDFLVPSIAPVLLDPLKPLFRSETRHHLRQPTRLGGPRADERSRLLPTPRARRSRSPLWDFSYELFAQRSFELRGASNKVVDLPVLECLVVTD